MPTKKLNRPLSILLADDDKDDVAFFTNALKELPFSTYLTVVQNGEELMHHLSENFGSLPDVLFLDLSMPRKTGFECLSEIKESELLKAISIFILSTSYSKDIQFEENMKHLLGKIGAQDYIRKPRDFAQLKQCIHDALEIVIKKIAAQKHN